MMDFKTFNRLMLEGRLKPKKGKKKIVKPPKSKTDDGTYDPHLTIKDIVLK